MPTQQYLTKLCKSFYEFKYALYKVIDSLCREEGITNMQAMMLFMIKSEKAISVGALSGIFNMTHSNASALCKKLERDGLVCRTRSKTDERTVLITLGERGEEVLSRMLKNGAGISDSLGEIPQDRLDTIIETLNEATHMLSNIVK